MIIFIPSKFLPKIFLFSLYAWIRASAIPLGFSFMVLGLFHILIRKLDKISSDATDEIKQKIN